MKLVTYPLLACVFAGCATKVTTLTLDVSTVDHPASRNIDVRFTNENNYPICIAAEDWPNQAGKVNQASDSVFLSVGAERFALAEFNTGYCKGKGCELRVLPGKQISGSLSYDDFKLPDRLVNEQKTLAYSPAAYSCSEK